MKVSLVHVRDPNRPLERDLDQWPFPDRESQGLDFVESMPLDVPRRAAADMTLVADAVLEHAIGESRAERARIQAQAG